ncbi:MAG: ribosome silencing factor [Defluviitaleaceae bacterium]|nr:ribosome silencing factor [Defluviitaleaceae bacterium]
MEFDAVMALKSALDKKFAKDIAVLDLGGVSPIADYFVIATGASAPQMAALTDTAEECLKAQGMTLHHTEGLQSGKWVLLDFGAIIVHIFDKESREYYNLERIWGDAKTVS